MRIIKVMIEQVILGELIVQDKRVKIYANTIFYLKS